LGFQLHIIWSGVIDLVIAENGRLFIVDHKTTSVEGDTYWKGFQLSQQFMGYVWAAQKIINKTIDGALANVLYGRAPTKTAGPWTSCDNTTSTVQINRRMASQHDLHHGGLRAQAHHGIFSNEDFSVCFSLRHLSLS